ncbi:MAG: MFS transporter [Hormoscilla sp. GM102CHS1]|nr:MFS transporter [Hormoscilla sp. GM102CHS1]
MLTWHKTFWSNRLRLPVLLVAGSLTTMAGGVVAPVLPDVIGQLQFDPAVAGNLVSIHCLTIALFSPPLGILADRIGPVRVLVPSLVLYAVFGMAGAWIDSFEPLLATRALLGAASGGLAAASLGLLGRMYEGQARSRVMGYATSTLTITGILFPALGGWVGARNWRMAFLLYGLALPLALLASSVFPAHNSIVRQPSGKSRTQSNQQLLQVLKHPQTWRLLLSVALTSVAMYAVVIYAPIYLKKTLGLGALMNGMVLASRALGAAFISAFRARQLASRLGPKKAIGVGLLLMAMTLVSIPFLHQLHWILVAAISFGAGFGIALPTLYNSLADCSPKDLRSSVLAAGTGAGFWGQFISPILLGPVLKLGGMEWVFYAAAFVALTACFLLRSPVNMKR